MKSVLSIVAFSFLMLNSLFAQRGGLAQLIKTSHTEISKPKLNVQVRDVFGDTLWSPAVKSLHFGVGSPFFIPGCEDFAFFSDGATGYATGTNQFHDLEKLRKAGLPGGFIGVLQTMVYFTHVVVAHDSTLVYSNLYRLDPVTHGPGEFIFSSDPKYLFEIYERSMSNNYTIFFFPASIPVEADSFFVSFTIPNTAGDTVVCGASVDSCYPGKQIAWEMRADSSFHPFNDGTSNSWEVNTELFIVPIVQPGNLINGVPKPITSNGITLNGAFPSPGSDVLNIKYEIETGGDVTIEIVDLLGRRLKSIGFGNQNQGTHQIKIDIRDLPSGIYNYGIKSNGKYLFSRFTRN